MCRNYCGYILCQLCATCSRGSSAASPDITNKLKNHLVVFPFTVSLIKGTREADLSTQSTISECDLKKSTRCHELYVNKGFSERGETVASFLCTLRHMHSHSPTSGSSVLSTIGCRGCRFSFQPSRSHTCFHLFNQFIFVSNHPSSVPSVWLE